MGNFKKASRSGRKNKLNLNQIDQKYGELKSICKDLSDLEIHLFTRINLEYSEKKYFTYSNLQLSYNIGVSELEIENAVNHLIDLKYFKIVPSAKNFSYLRHIEPDEANSELTKKLIFFFLSN